MAPTNPPPHATTPVDLGAGPVPIDTRIVPLVRAVNEAGLRTVSSCEGDAFDDDRATAHLTFEVWEGASEFVAICFERGAQMEWLRRCTLEPTWEPEIGVLRGLLRAPTRLLAHLQHVWVPDLDDPFADLGLAPDPDIEG